MHVIGCPGTGRGHFLDWTQEERATRRWMTQDDPGADGTSSTKLGGLF